LAGSVEFGGGGYEKHRQHLSRTHLAGCHALFDVPGDAEEVLILLNGKGFESALVDRACPLAVMVRVPATHVSHRQENKGVRLDILVNEGKRACQEYLT
jgi:hypothetical protein